jgi:hypothetical protein
MLKGYLKIHKKKKSDQGTITEGEGSVRLPSSLRKFVYVKKKKSFSMESS